MNRLAWLGLASGLVLGAACDDGGVCPGGAQVIDGVCKCAPTSRWETDHCVVDDVGADAAAGSAIGAPTGSQQPGAWDLDSGSLLTSADGGTTVVEASTVSSAVSGAQAMSDVQAATDGQTATDAQTASDAASMPVAVIDECASGMVCPAEYPCVDLVDGYTCLGQFADWPMPGTLGFSASYSGDADTVADLVTGLVWQRSIPQTYPGCSEGSPAGSGCTLEEAHNYCDGLQLAGQTDWRLASAIELISIANATAPMGIDSSWFTTRTLTLVQKASPTQETFQVSYFLSSSKLGSGRSLGVNMGDEDTASIQRAVGSIEPASAGLVRCVRGVPNVSGSPSERFAVNSAEGTVHDRRTHLTWRRPTQLLTQSDSLTVSQARDHCAKAGDYFTLPSLAEMMTLFDASYNNPAVNPAVSTNMQNQNWPIWTRDGHKFTNGWKYLQIRIGVDSGSPPMQVSWWDDIPGAVGVAWCVRRVDG